MSRKRWRVTSVPSFTTEQFDSRVAAYRQVQRYREDRRLGMTRVQRLTVYVSEDKGPWVTYERIELSPPSAVSASVESEGTR